MTIRSELRSPVRWSRGWGPLQSECFHGRTFKSVEAFILEIKRYIRYYNHDRIKEKLKGLSPVEYRTQALVPG